MTRLLLILLLGLGSPVAPEWAAHAKSPEGISSPEMAPLQLLKPLHNLQRATVRISAIDAWGISMGCGVATRYGVVTANHVVARAIRVFVVGSDGVAVQATGWRKVAPDVALVDAPLAGRHMRAPVARRFPSKPVGVVSPTYWSNGFINGRMTMMFAWIRPDVPAKNPAEYFEVSEDHFCSTEFPVDLGQSGSGVFRGGELIGVICAKDPRPPGMGGGFHWISRVTERVLLSR